MIGTIEITPELLADIEAKAKAALSADGSINRYNDFYIAQMALHVAANPAVVLAMIAAIKRLREAQCWVIVDEDGDTVEGPFFTEKHAVEELSQMPAAIRVLNDFSVRQWEGGE